MRSLAIAAVAVLVVAAALAATAQPATHPRALGLAQAKTAIRAKVHALAKPVQDIGALYIGSEHLVRCAKNSRTRVTCSFSVGGIIPQDAYSGKSQSVDCKGHARADLVRGKARATILDWQFTDGACHLLHEYGAGGDG